MWFIHTSKRYKGLPIQNTDKADPYRLQQRADKGYGSQGAREKRRPQHFLTSFGPQMKPTFILKDRLTQRQMYFGEPPGLTK